MSLLTGTSIAVFSRPKNNSGVIDENRARLEFQKNLTRTLLVMGCVVHFGRGSASKIVTMKI